jgi:hypothetical protein
MNRERLCEDPASLTSLMRSAEARLAARERLPDLELALIVEGHRGTALPAAITDYLTQHFRGEIRAVRGPKPQSELAKEFRFGPAHQLYNQILPLFEYLAKRPKYKRRRANSGSGYRDQTLKPGERALEYVREKLGDEDLRTISGRSLANEFSKRRHRAIEAREFPEDDPNAHPTDKPDSETSLP